MKTLTFLLSVLLLIGCSNSSENGEVSQPIETESRKCAGTISDFLRLQRKELQDDLLAKIDSTRKVQYPDNDQEASAEREVLEPFLVNP